MIKRILLAAALLASAGILLVIPGGAHAELDNTPWRVPETPPACTEFQGVTGDVAGCLLAFAGHPATTGWGVPPAPGVGDGWDWNGSTYNGSTALLGWESTLMVRTTQAIGGIKAGLLRSHRGVRLLFEGFLTEISANGYRLSSIGGYGFRCTNTNGGWSCPSRRISDLSNHAWGLAFDMNGATNPIVTYSGINGATACATPIATDLPRWVIQTAERWGLYWGGYGWGSGCASALTQRTSVYRDPPHFEFRGTPAQAEAVLSFHIFGDPTAFCRDIIMDDGYALSRCNRLGIPGDGWRTPVEVVAPDGAAAVMINLTATGARASGFITIEGCGPQPSTRTTSALNYAKAQSIATMVIVPLDADQRFCVYRKSAVHTVVDVVAFLGANGERFLPSTPVRLVNTRETALVASGSEQQFASDATTRLVNVIAVGAAGSGYLKLGECGTLASGATFSHVNFGGGITRSNMAVARSGPEGSCVYTTTETNVVVDELGVLSVTDGLGWNITAPRRALDTRTCSVTWCGGRPVERSVVRLNLGTVAPGAAIAVTVTRAQSDGFVSVGRCVDIDQPGGPSTSNVNVTAGMNVTNLAIVQTSGGEICLYTSMAAHLIVDVQATLIADGSVGVLPIEPLRVHDSRLA